MDCNKKKPLTEKALRVFLCPILETKTFKSFAHSTILFIFEYANVGSRYLLTFAVL